MPLTQYTSFIVHYPNNSTKIEFEFRVFDLLSGVINCGVIPLDVPIEYETDRSGEYTEVPADIRQRAADYWVAQV